ncbi:MFS transporter [Modestobacter sp. KNN46-3]|uniref:MFS transporter n=1 Tax=Modestobacter sp. KNN46-3 TaxID=2711218 RepID=UPI001F155115|nr:MFS transporter [Modestobacter sp. KNN46-3]
MHHQPATLPRHGTGTSGDRHPQRQGTLLSRRRPRSDRGTSRPATYGQVFAVGEFRPLFGSYLLSTIGDELARVALTVLVYQRTESALLSAITFGISYLPWILGGPVLAALADRLPRHRVLITSDLARAALVAAMAVPGLPLALLLGLLLLVSLCSPPFEAARSALMADVLEGDRYAVATSLTGVTAQLSQLIGFLLGGALLLHFSPSAALLLNAATFAVSAGWLALGLQRRPAPGSADAGTEVRSLWRETASGMRFVATTPRLLSIVGVLWVAALFVNAPEGIATPLGLQLQGTTAATGILLAAAPAGTALGGLVVGRFCPPHVRERLLAPLVALSLGGVLLAGLVPVWLGTGSAAFAAVVALFFVAGIGGACSIPLNVAFVQAVPSAYRGRAFGVAAAGLAGVQGLGVVLAGLGAEVLAPNTVVALSGGIGLVVVVVPLIALRRSRPGETTARVSPAPVPGGPSQS